MKVFTVLLFITSGIFANTLEKGIELYKNEKFKEASIIFEKLVYVNKENVEAYFWLGQSLLRLNQVTRLWKVLKQHWN